MWFAIHKSGIVSDGTRPPAEVSNRFTIPSTRATTVVSVLSYGLATDDYLYHPREIHGRGAWWHWTSYRMLLNVASLRRRKCRKAAPSTYVIFTDASYDDRRTATDSCRCFPTFYLFQLYSFGLFILFCFYWWSGAASVLLVWCTSIWSGRQESLDNLTVRWLDVCKISASVCSRSFIDTSFKICWCQRRVLNCDNNLTIMWLV